MELVDYVVLCVLAYAIVSNVKAHLHRHDNGGAR
jgi:hypothetical protein